MIHDYPWKMNGNVEKHNVKERQKEILDPNQNLKWNSHQNTTEALFVNVPESHLHVKP